MKLMNTAREESYIESHDFLEINVCLTQTIVRLTYLLEKISYLDLSGIDRTLMTNYLKNEIEDLSEFCIKTIEKYFPENCLHLPGESTKERFMYHANYYFGFTIDGLDFLALTLQKNNSIDPHILYDFVQESFKSATKMLESITMIINSSFTNISCIDLSYPLE